MGVGSKVIPCPRCGGRLDPRRYREVHAELCDGCRGILVGSEHLTPLLSEIHEDYIRGSAAEIEPVADKGAGLRCPRCGEPMENHGYLESEIVRIDSCDRCHLIWIDTDELRPMALLYARTVELREERTEDAPGWPGGAVPLRADAVVAEFQRRRSRLARVARLSAPAALAGALGLLFTAPLARIFTLPVGALRGLSVVCLFCVLLVLTLRANSDYRCPRCNEVQIHPWLLGSTGLRGLWGLRLDPSECLRCDVPLR